MEMRTKLGVDDISTCEQYGGRAAENFRGADAQHQTIGPTGGSGEFSEAWTGVGVVNPFNLRAVVTSADFAKATRLPVAAAEAKEESDKRAQNAEQYRAARARMGQKRLTWGARQFGLPLNANSHAATVCDNMRVGAKVAEEGLEPPTRGL